MRLRNTELLTEKEIQTKISDYYLKSKVDNEEDKLDEMTLVYSSYGYNLYHDRKSAEVAVENTKTGQILFTNPYDVNTGISSDAIKQELMSQIIIKYTDLSTGNTFEMLSYTDAAIKQQIQTKYIRGGIRVEYTIGKECPLCDLALKDIYSKYKIKVLICAVRRGDDITIPKGEFILKEGDKINITASPKNIHDFFEAIGSFKRPVKSVMIVGGSMIAYYLANQLIDMNIDVKIVDMNTKRCEELSEMLPKASIVCANATENDLLLEEGIMDFDGFVALTGLDEMNIIYGMYAKTKNVEKVITKVHHLSFPEVIESSGIESVISPKLITAERISSYVRAIQNSYSKNKVESLRRIVDNRIEALEFIVREDESFIGIPLKDLPIKDNVLVAAIVRHGKAIIPGGYDVIKKGDSVVVITPDIASIEELNDIMR